MPFAEFAAHHDIGKAGFEVGTPDEVRSYCWSNTREAVGRDRDADDPSENIGTVGYRLRWKQKGRAREEWYDIVVKPERLNEVLDDDVITSTDTAAIVKEKRP